MSAVQMPLPGASSPRPHLLAELEVAERLSVSRSCLAAWRRTGGGPAYFKLGGAVRYAEADVDAFLAAARRSA